MLFDSPGALRVPLEPLIGTQSVIGLSGDQHRRARQLLLPPFHGERMRSDGELMREITEQVMTEYPPGQPFAARQRMQTISLRVILRAVFGLNEGTRCQRIEQLLSAMLDSLGNPLNAGFLFFPSLGKNFGTLSPWGNFVRKRQQTDRLIYEAIADRRAHPDPSRKDICSETLRIYPVSLLTFPRIAQSPVQLTGVALEPGNTVAGCIYLVHRRPDLYPEPEKFNPDRFLQRHYSPFEFLPFGGGFRRCIGMAFAQFEMRTVLSSILTGFELGLVHGGSVRHRSRGLATAPSPFRMVAKRRRQSQITCHK